MYLYDAKIIKNVVKFVLNKKYVMTISLKHIPCLIALLLPSLGLGGQQLSPFGKAGEITDGVLPNGISYYLVQNRSFKGTADFALVQQGEPDVRAARGALKSAPHFGDRSPLRFLAGHGVAYSEKGLVSYLPASTRFDFRDVPVYDEAVADSTLMLLFDIAGSNPYSQAVVVSGDINPASTLERMKMFSMMVPRRESAPAVTYEWGPRDSLRRCVTRNLSDNVAVINLIYSTERIARENLGTAVPVVMKAYSSELGIVLRKRLSSAFRSAGVPLADFRYSYYDSSCGPDDERYRISVYTAASRLEEAMEIVASVLGGLDRSGATLGDLQSARVELLPELRGVRKKYRTPNPVFVDKCVSSYLYGTSLASDDAVRAFLLNKKLPDDKELGLFNGFLKAMLDPVRNLTLRIDVPMDAADPEGLVPLFSASWEKDPPQSWRPSALPDADRLPLYTALEKVKLRGESPDPISGGKIWTFSNGVKVVFKKTPGTGAFDYGLMLRGGFADVPDLIPGEAVFVSDMLADSRISGMSGRDFRESVAASGITMDMSVGLSDLRITGSAPKDKIQTLVSILLSVARDRQPDNDGFEYWLRTEKLRHDMMSLSPRDMNSLMDGFMYPDYKFSGVKDASVVGNDFADRCERYFARQFSKVNDGVFVIVGDLEEETLKKLLCRTLGDFRTQQRIAHRPAVSKPVISGNSNHISEAVPGTVGGGELGASLALSSDIPFTLPNYMSFKVACSAVSKKLTGVLADYGAFAVVSGSMEFFPAERMTIYINIRPCYADGLPEGVDPSDPVTLPEAIRKFLDGLSSMAPDAADVNGWKAALLNDMDDHMARTETVVDNVLLRYSGGKDVAAGYKNAVSSVSVDSVRNILSSLSSGGRVEYVIL